MKNIIEQREGKIKLRDSEEKYRLITEHAQELICVLNEKNEYEYINEDAFLRVLGYSNEDLLGQSRFDIIHPDDYEKGLKKLMDAWENGEGTTEVRLKAKNGEYIWFDVYGRTFIGFDGKTKGLLVSRDISERKMLEEKLHWQATHDHLTQLCNRRYFEDQLEIEVSRVQQGDIMNALVYLDLDRFKYINDTAGHDAGDKLLIEIARLLTDKLRDQDLLARLGGDEFAIILRDVNAESAMELAESFRDALDKCNFVYGGQNYNVHGSFGVALMDIDDMTSGD